MARVKKAQSGWTGGRKVVKEYSPDKSYVTKEVTIGGVPKKTVTRRTFKGFIKGKPRVGKTNEDFPDYVQKKIPTAETNKEKMKKGGKVSKSRSVVKITKSKKK